MAATTEAAATAEAAETAEMAEMAKAAKRRVGGNRERRGSTNRSRGGDKQKKSSMDSKSGAKTPSPEGYFCLEPHRASKCPKRSSSATVPATPNSQHGRLLGSVRPNLGARLLTATSARPALTARGAPRERHEDEY